MEVNSLFKESPFPNSLFRKIIRESYYGIDDVNLSSFEWTFERETAEIHYEWTSLRQRQSYHQEYLIYSLIKDKLILCLVDPHPYIRRFAELIAEKNIQC